MAQGFDEPIFKDETITAAASAMGWQTGETPFAAYTRRVGVL